MRDKFSPEVRRKTMQAVKSRDTVLENMVLKALYSEGIRYRRNVRDLQGTPDIAIKKLKTVVFIDSCFWHGCEKHFRLPVTHSEYWKLKIDRNKARDIKTNQYYANQGWNLMRVWEHDLKQDFEGSIKKLIEFIREHAQTGTTVRNS